MPPTALPPGAVDLPLDTVRAGRHRKTFTIEVVVNAEVLGVATGRAKKEAEQEAARLALARLDEQGL